MTVHTTMPKFNPSGDERVATIKTNIEWLINYLQDLVDGVVPQVNSGPDNSPETRQEAPDGRSMAIAMTKLEEASMWAVRAIYVGRDR